MVVSSLSLLYAQENNEGERPVMIEKENEQELSSNPLSNIFQNKNQNRYIRGPISQNIGFMCLFCSLFVVLVLFFCSSLWMGNLL